ncbi:MAG TPA: type IIL restriction-modification enzyme MmeI [Polyangiaceae bacterium]|nr:type IIL restriction-modification enzyme MmeI [Polyangiaceae bacterium]
MIDDDVDLDDLGRAVAAHQGRRVANVSGPARRRVEELARRLPDATPAELLGALFESAMPSAERRGRGTHFTTASLAREVVERALGDASIDVAAPPRILDPAMGAGVFLEAALGALVRRSGEPDSPHLRRRLAEAALHGIDRDERACRLARWSIAIAVGEPEPRLDALGDAFVSVDALLDAPLGDVPGTSWHRAFPDVFARGREGFDFIVGNPPFLGGKRIRTVHGDAYAAHLAGIHPGASKNTDLAAHFLRRSFDHLAPGGALGFVVTSSIAEGDTREGGLAAIVRRGGTIFAAVAAHPWPGSATVVISLVWIRRGEMRGPRWLDGEEVAVIDPWLTAIGETHDPPRIASMRGRAFIGSFLRGKGFVFDDGADEATPLSVARELLAADPAASEVIRPFLGGEEVMTHPEHAPHRFVIAFGGRSLERARAHPRALAIVEAKVRPFREARRSTSADARHSAKWWQFANHRPALAAASAGLERVIVIPRMTAQLVAVMVPAGPVFSDQLVVVASDSFAVLALLSSSVHAAWTERHASTLGDGLRYTPTDVFETFPPPHGSFEAVGRDRSLADAGERFHHARRAALLERRVGLSVLLRDLDDPSVQDESVFALRDAIRALEIAVLGAYGWGDLADALEHERHGHRLSIRGRREVLRRLLAESARVAEAGGPTPRRSA